MARVNASKPQLQALEVFKDMIADPTARAEFADAPKADKKKIFDKHKGGKTGKWDDIPDGARQHLEDLSDDHLKLLAELDAAFVSAGLYVETNPVPLMIH